jgi:hypothetical protein
MIRAVIKNGLIQPLEPLPPDWEDGREVVVDDLEEQSSNGATEIDTWAEDMKTLTAALNDPQEWSKIESTLAEADRQSKAGVRRDMELP